MTMMKSDARSVSLQQTGQRRCSSTVNPWVSCSTHLTAVSERWTTNAHLQGTRVDGYYELGASAYHRFHVGYGVMELRFDVKNLTDKQYEIVGAYPMPGRSYQLSINYKL